MRGALALLLALVSSLAQAAEPFRVAVSEANAAPFVLYQQGRLDGGIARDLIDALAVELQLEAEYLNLPRGRVELSLRAGEIEAACFLSPAWVEDAAALAWSPVLFEIQQVVVSLAAHGEVRGPEQLLGRKVGTLLNYVYPELEPHFAARRIIREDAVSVGANLLKLERGRIDALIDVDLSVLYQAEHGQLPIKLRIDPLWAPPSPVHCAFNLTFVAAHPRLIPALEAMVRAGRVQGWIEAYTGGRRVERTQ